MKTVQVHLIIWTTLVIKEFIAWQKSSKHSGEDFEKFAAEGKTLLKML